MTEGTDMANAWAKPAKLDEPGPFARIADAIEADALVLAEAKEAELKARLERALEQAEANRSKAHALAFDAEGKDDAEAKRLMSKLLTDADKLDADIRHRLEPAVAEAQRRVDAARQVVADDRQRAKAREAYGLAEQLQAVGLARDAAFAAARSTGLEFDAVLAKLRALDAPVASRELVSVNTARALDAALMGVHPAARPVPPLDRHSFAELAVGWSRPTLAWCAKILEPAATDKGSAAA
jgi:hypothetical protein